MSQRPRRNVPRIDYARVHARGIEIHEVSESEASSVEDVDEPEHLGHLELRLESEDEEDVIEVQPDSDDDVSENEVDSEIHQRIDEHHDTTDEDAWMDEEDDVRGYVEMDTIPGSESTDDDDDFELPDIPEYVPCRRPLVVADIEDDNDIHQQEPLDAPIDAALQENADEDDDENAMLPPGFCGPNHITLGRDNTPWTYLCPTPTRARLHNILPQGFRTGPCGPGIPATLTKKGYFSLMFSQEMTETVVLHTNRYAQLVLEAHNHIYGSDMQWSPTDLVEMEAYIGLLLRAGIERNYDQLTTQFWSRNMEKHRVAFVATMSLKRFQQLTSFVRFDCVETRKPGIQEWLREKIRRRRLHRETGVQQPSMPSLQQVRQSKLDAIKNIFDPFVGNIQSCFEPDTHITIDEMLVRFRGRCPFRVYMPKKPGRYGIKIWAAVCNSSGYVLNLQIYEGKIGPQPERDLGRRVVHDLMELYNYSGRGITIDNFFTSVILAEEMLEKQLTVVGTIRKSRRELPKAFVNPKGKALLSSEFIFKGDVTAVSYVAKRSKSVTLISTEHHDTRISEDPNDKSKPDIILHYNSTKGGVDTVDQMIQRYTCQRPTAKWPSKIFHAQLDVAALNAYRLWMAHNPDWEPRNKSRRREFLFQLSRELVIPNIQRRSLIPVFHKPIKDAIRAMGIEPVGRALGNLPPVPNEAVRRTSATPRKCSVCHKSSRSYCSDCGRFICKDHQSVYVYCPNCRPIQVELPVA